MLVVDVCIVDCGMDGNFPERKGSEGQRLGNFRKGERRREFFEGYGLHSLRLLI